MTEGDPASEPALDRAEALVDEAAHRAEEFLARSVARAREELEDIWAEAKSLREQDR